jgi:hypothetical protein
VGAMGCCVLLYILVQHWHDAYALTCPCRASKVSVLLDAVQVQSRGVCCWALTQLAPLRLQPASGLRYVTTYLNDGSSTSVSSFQRSYAVRYTPPLKDLKPIGEGGWAAA